MLKILIALLAVCLRVSSATLTFEGLPDGSPIGDFYSSLGLSFTGATAFVDSDDGGSGDFGGEPSPSTAVFSVTGIVIESQTGLIGPIQFYFGNPNGTTHLRVYSGPGLSRDLLFDVLLNATVPGGSPDPTGYFGPFVVNTADFVGVAKSLAVVSRAPGGFFLDDLTLTPVPEPRMVWFWPIAIPGFAALRCRQTSVGMAANRR